jgi:hypothetical protein
VSEGEVLRTNGEIAKCKKGDTEMSNDYFTFDGKVSVPLTVQDVIDQRTDKVEFFRQGWREIDQLLIDFSNKDYLQLVVNLINRDGVAAALYSGMNTKTSNMTMHYDSRPPCVPACSFKHFCACIRVLAKMKTPRRNLMPYIVYEDFVRLYDCVAANAKYCSTLVTDRRYAIGLYPTMSFLNHSCDPNCLLVGKQTSS